MINLHPKDEVHFSYKLNFMTWTAVDAFVRNRMEGQLSVVAVACKECSFSAKFWEDGTPRLTKASVPAEYRKYVDLYHYDGYGEPIWELVVAEHDAKFERNLMKYVRHMARKVG